MTLILNFSHELAMEGIVITICALSFQLMLVKHCALGGSFSFSLKLGCLLLYLYVLCAGETHVCFSNFLVCTKYHCKLDYPFCILCPWHVCSHITDLNFQFSM